MLGLAPVSGGDMVWTFIDGTPTPTASNIEGSLNGPRGGVAAAGAWAANTSIAIAADNTLHISYQDLEGFTLKYMHGTPGAAGSYTWTSHTIDTEGSNGTPDRHRPAPDLRRARHRLHLSERGRHQPPALGGRLLPDARLCV